MSVPVTVRPEARQDILSGQSFFNQRRPGSGRSFAVEVLTVLDHIGDMPELYVEITPGVRAAGVRRFGYVVYYRVVSNEVEVIAVLHGGRDPNVWQTGSANERPIPSARPPISPTDIAHRPLAAGGCRDDSPRF